MQKTRCDWPVRVPVHEVRFDVVKRSRNLRSDKLLPRLQGDKVVHDLYRLCFIVGRKTAILLNFFF